MRLLPQEADEAGITTIVWRRHRPFHPERLYQALEDLCCAAVRSRGRFWLADHPDTLLAWDAAGGALCVESAGPWLASLPDAAWEAVPPVRRAAAALDWHPDHDDRCQHLVFTSPAWTVTDSRGCWSPACSPTPSTRRDPKPGKNSRPHSAPSSTPSRRTGPIRPDTEGAPWPPAKAPASR